MEVVSRAQKGKRRGAGSTEEDERVASVVERCFGKSRGSRKEMEGREESGASR